MRESRCMRPTSWRRWPTASPPRASRSIRVRRWPRRSGSSPVPRNWPAMSDILDKIVAAKRQEIAASLRERDLAFVRRAAEALGGQRDFVAALRGRIEQGGAAVIAEIKKASPSRGVLREDFVPAQIAVGYAQH